MSDDYQIEIPPSFLSLHVDAGRQKPNATREVIAARYELCEDLAGHLVEHAQTLYHVQAPSEAEILRRIHAGLCTAESGVSTAEATWIVTRLAELLVWPCPDLVVPPPEQPAAPEVP